MNRSTKRKLLQSAIILGVLVSILLCYLMAGWTGPLVIMVFALTIAGIVWGIFNVSKIFGKNQWLNVAIFSGWVGILVAAASFILMLLDPRSRNFSLSYILITAGSVGLAGLIGGFAATYINWHFLRNLKSLGKKNRNGGSSN